MLRGQVLWEYLLLSVLFGSTYTAIHLTKTSIPPFTVVALRLVVGTACYLSFHCARVVLCASGLRGANSNSSNQQPSQPPFTWTPIVALQLLALGVGNLALPLALIRIAVRCLSLSVVEIIQTTKPMFALAFSLLLMADSRPLHWLRPVGMCVAFVGVVIMSLHLWINHNPDLCSDAEYNAYTLLVLLSACLGGLCAVLTEKHLSHIPNFTLAAGQTGFGAVFAVVLSLVVDYNSPPYGYDAYVEELQEGDWVAFVSLLYLGTVATCVGWYLFFSTNKTMGAVKQLSYVYVEMFVSVVEGVVLLRDWNSITIPQRLITCLGGAMAVAGTMLCLHDEGAAFAYAGRYRFEYKAVDGGDDQDDQDDQDDHSSVSDYGVCEFNQTSGSAQLRHNGKQPLVPM